MIHFGWDKGQDIKFNYPIYRLSNLKIPPPTRTLLLNHLNDLANYLQDWQLKPLLMNIIDPDLNPNYFINKLPLNPSDIKNLIILEPKNPGLNIITYKSKQVISSIDELSKRNQYSWFPVDVLIKPDNNIEVLGEINNLAKEGNESLYECLFCVFKEMIIGFRELEIFQDDVEQVVQVVVKAQKLVVEPGKIFEEFWHLDGENEDVVAGGCYFLMVGQDGDFNYMDFKVKKYPHETHKEFDGICQVKVPVNE